MKIHKQKKYSEKTLLLILSTLLAILLAIFIVCLYVFKGSLFGWSPIVKQPSPSSINYSKPTEEQKKAGSDIKRSNTDNTYKPNDTGNHLPEPTPQPNSKSGVDIAITHAQQNGAVLQIRSIISTITNEGACSLTLTHANKTIQKTVAVQALPGSSTCKGFDIPVSELSAGEWQVALHFENDTLLANTSTTVNIQ